jgi:trimeric autotransporter adhesin
VATVSTSGVVTGQGVGTATITATSEGQSATATVTVALAPVATVSVSPSAPSVGVGQSVQLSATLRDAAGNLLTGRTVTLERRVRRGWRP